MYVAIVTTMLVLVSTAGFFGKRAHYWSAFTGAVIAFGLFAYGNYRWESWLWYLPAVYVAGANLSNTWMGIVCLRAFRRGEELHGRFRSWDIEFAKKAHLSGCVDFIDRLLVQEDLEKLRIKGTDHNVKRYCAIRKKHYAEFKKREKALTDEKIFQARKELLEKVRVAFGETAAPTDVNRGVSAPS